MGNNTSTYSVLNSEYDYTAVEKEYEREDSRMLKKGYSPIKTETNRHGEDVKTLTDIFQKHFPALFNKKSEQGAITTITLSERTYQNNKGERKKITFLEETREEYCLVNYFPRPTKVVKKIEENLETPVLSLC